MFFEILLNHLSTRIYFKKKLFFTHMEKFAFFAENYLKPSNNYIFSKHRDLVPLS